VGDEAPGEQRDDAADLVVDDRAETSDQQGKRSVEESGSAHCADKTQSNICRECP
jgi:hypothetical protein